MIEILISMFGMIIILRILSHLRKFQLINQKKQIQLFVLFQVPFYLSLYFKELFAVSILYIGFFLVSLMLFQKILTFSVKKTHERRSILFIDELILMMKTGKSAQASLKLSYLALSEWEKTVFKPCLFCFEQEFQSNDPIHRLQKFYFDELRLILNSSTKVIDQLISFREGMKIQRNLRHRSGQVTKQIKAQAVVAVVIYGGIFALSWHHFNLKNEIGLIVVSILLFVSGEALIFLVGGQIKWKT